MARGYVVAALLLLSATATAQPPEFKWHVQAADDAVHLTLYRYPGKQCQCGPHEVWSTSWPGASNPQSQNLPSCGRQGLPAFAVTIQFGETGQQLNIYCADGAGSRPRLLVEKRAAKIEWLVNPNTSANAARPVRSGQLTWTAPHGEPIVRLQDGSGEPHCSFWRNALVDVACPLPQP